MTREAPPRPTTPPGDGRSSRPGLRAQIGSTRSAAMGLLSAHIDLAKAEAGDIAGQVARAAALAGVALLLGVLALFLVVIGFWLWIGDWLFGSMGWGVVHGVLSLLGTAMAVVLLAIGVTAGRIGRALLAGVVVGVIASIVLGLDLPNRLYTAIGDGLGLAIEPGLRPLVVGLVVGALVGLGLGAIAALRMGDGSGATRTAIVVGLAIAGVVVGAITAVTFGPAVGVALGIAIGLDAWIAFMAADVARSGIDLEALKRRFYPSQTIDTSKETLEWLKQRMPPGIGS